MIKDGTYKLRTDAKLPNGTELPAGTILEVKMQTVYFYNNPIGGSEQTTVLKWIEENPSLFK